MKPFTLVVPSRSREWDDAVIMAHALYRELYEDDDPKLFTGWRKNWMRWVSVGIGHVLLAQDTKYHDYVGYIAGKMTIKNPESLVWEASELWVSPEVRGMGVGRDLVQGFPVALGAVQVMAH